MGLLFFFFQAEDGIRDRNVTGVQTCALPILWLRAQGYAEQTVRHAHAHARRFGDDLARRGLDELAGLTEDDAEAFLRRLTLRAQSRLRSSGARSVRSSLRQLFRFLRAAGIVAPAPVSVAADGF